MKFYKTRITVEILSSYPYTLHSLSALDHDTTDGDCSGRILKDDCEEITESLFRTLCDLHHTDPDFFFIQE